MLTTRLPAAEGERGGEAGTEAPPGGYGCSGRGEALDRESVFEWFGLRLSPARRVHLLAGLLHMCQPLELRFLGSCLEELARRDFHVLRDAEARANSAAELRRLADAGDPLVLSHLLVCLPLLGSGNRECASVLYGALVGVDVRRAAGDHLERLALLFAMASLHPAFTFHQREAVRAQLERVDALLEERSRGEQEQQQAPGPCPPADEVQGSRAWTPCHLGGVSQSEAVCIEQVKLKEISRAGDSREFCFEVKWSDSSSTSETRSQRELQDLLLKGTNQTSSLKPHHWYLKPHSLGFELSKGSSAGGFEQDLLSLLSQVGDLERTLRSRFSSVPREFLQMCQASGFFVPATPPPRCSHCNGTPAARPHQPPPRFSETSSLDEDLDAYGVPCTRTHGVAGPGHGKQRVDGWESRRRNVHALNGDASGRRRGAAEPDRDHVCENAGVCVSAQNCADERAAPKIKARPVPKRDRGRRAPAGKGIPRVPAVPTMNQAVCSGRDTYRDTSSESSNSIPSSPVHHQRSAEAQDTETQSDNSVPDPPDPPGGPVRKAVATVNPLVTDPERCGAEAASPDSVPVSGDPPPPICPSPRPPPRPSATPAVHPQMPHTGSVPVTAPAFPPPETTSYANCAASPQQPHQHPGCNACGCRGTCGGTGAHQSPAGFFLPAPPPPRPLFGPPAPFFQLCGTAFSTQGHQAGGAPLPFYAHATPASFTAGALLQAHSDHLMPAGPQVAAFGRFYPPVFPPVGGVKKSNAASCYNCGVGGHYAPDCKQTPTDAAGQPGGFRLQYTVPHSETLDQAD